MTPVGMDSVRVTPSQTVSPQAKTGEQDTSSAPLKVEQTKVTLSDEGKALLAALKDIEKEEKAAEQGEKTVGDKVNSFTSGALGMEHPDKAEEQEEDVSYSAGQYLSAAATIGGLLLALV